MIVVKVGGSLYDHPDLGFGLPHYLERLARIDQLLVVPGGGDVADAVRGWDVVHQLGAEVSHRLAVRSLAVTSGFLAHLLADTPATVVDVEAFLQQDDVLPHTWAVTSDSIAARVAVVRKAQKLVLLKSIDVPSQTPWPAAAASRWVDAHFPAVVADARFAIEVVNFRRYLDQFSPPR